MTPFCLCINTIMTQKKIGVLLPQSKAYPSIAKDFMNGLKLSLDESYECKIEGIGLGNDQKIVINAIQKLSSQETVDLSTGLIGHYNTNEVLDFIEGLEETFIYSDLGANRPISLEGKKYITCNSLDLYQMTTALGQYLTDKTMNRIGMSSCYYDVGYGFIEAMEQALKRSQNGEFVGHFITPHHPRENEAELMHLFTEQSKPDAIFGFHNGIFAEEYATFLAQSKVYENTPLYLSPFSIGDQILEKNPVIFDGSHCISSWFPNLATQENTLFVEKYMLKYKKTPSFFSLLGYENGCLIHNHFNKKEAKGEMVAAGPRGNLKVDPITNRTIFPYYLWKLNAVGDTYEKKLQEILAPIDINTNEEPYDSASGWMNAYLCH
jgi:branched-chain amino acid transport system substrate-binding protein